MWLSMPDAGPSRPHRRDEKTRIAEWERIYALEKKQVDQMGLIKGPLRRQGSGEGISSVAASSVDPSAQAAASSANESSSTGIVNAPAATSMTAETSPSASSTPNLDSSAASSLSASPTSPSLAPIASQADATTSPTKSISFYTYTRTHLMPSPSFVPGQTFNLQLGGELADEAVYAVPVTLGHGDGVTRRGQRRDAKDMVGIGRRQQGAAMLQKLMLQVDLGSSDMWVATTGCMSADCRAARLFDATGSIDSGVSTNLTYHSGSVSGEIMWEAVTMSIFSIAYQAFVASSDVVNQNLDGGEYSGILGLALPANSIISSEIPGTTSNDPDGAIFLDNLFGSGMYAPTQRIFSLALERRNDVRTRSFLTLGSVDDKYCPAPCEPHYLPIIAQPSLGSTGYLHWRIALQGIRATKWANEAEGKDPTTTTIQLGPSIAVPSRNQPLAVLDSGGVAILVGNLAYANAIYAPWGVTAGSDGLYRLPCKTQLALSFNFGNTWYDVHPLDLSWPDPSDPSQQTCIGAVQYTGQLGSRGDFVLGSSFLKNVYSIFSYPDPTVRGTWQPAVGLYPLTNGSAASTDFYAVRYMRQPLSSVSADGADLSGTSSTSPSTGSPGSEQGGSVMNTTAIVAGSVVGFFAIAAALFCGWWFWLRHKYGGDGKVVYREAPERKSVASTEDASSRRGRHRKHESTQRQRSMIEGYKDGFDDQASWTDNGDSIRMTHLGDLAEEDEDIAHLQSPDISRGKPMMSHSPSLGGASSLVEHSTPTMQLVDLVEPPLMTEGAIALPLTPLQLTRQHSSVPSYVSAAGDDGGGTPGSVRPLLLPSPGLSTPGAHEGIHAAQPDRAARRTSTSPQRDFGLSLSAHIPRSASASMSMSGPFPSPMPHTPSAMSGTSGRRPSANEATQPRAGVRSSMRHLDSSPMYDIQTTDYFDVKPAEPAWRRRGRSGDRDGGTGV